jgi:hypothetical protein
MAIPRFWIDDWDDDEDDFDDVLPDEEALDLGSCCCCGKWDETVRNLISLEYLAPVPGTGWGCVVCGIPANGALTIICDACLARDDWAEELRFIISGYPAGKGRLPVGEMSHKHFDHDYRKHPEVDGAA